MISKKTVADGSRKIRQAGVYHGLVRLTYEGVPLLIRSDYRDLWNNTTGFVRPRSSRRDTLSFTEPDYEYCLRSYPQLLCYTLRSDDGKFGIKFRPEVTRTTIERELEGLPADEYRSHPLLKAWKVFFISSDPYFIAPVTLNRMLRDRLEGVPSFVLETIRYNPDRSCMLGSCSYMEEALPVLGKIGGTATRQFLSDMQHYSFVNRKRDPYILSVIAEILIAMIRNNVPLDEVSPLQARLRSLITRRIGFEYENAANSPVQAITFEDLASYVNQNGRNRRNVQEFLQFIDRIRMSRVTRHLVIGEFE